MKKYLIITCPYGFNYERHLSSCYVSIHKQFHAASVETQLHAQILFSFYFLAQYILQLHGGEVVKKCFNVVISSVYPPQVSSIQPDLDNSLAHVKLHTSNTATTNQLTD